MNKTVGSPPPFRCQLRPGLVMMYLMLFMIVNAGSSGWASQEHHRHKPQLRVFSDSHKMIEEGRKTFRFDTFGDEAFWGDTLRLHEAIAGAQHGGVGPGVSPNTALAVGLKVDTRALPRSLKRKIRQGKVDLDDPATTLALLKLNAVVGVKGFFDEYGTFKSIGIQCALCHSTVDDSFAPGIGKRLDGWANQDLNVGVIIALAPDLSFFANLLNLTQETVREVLNTWGPGKFDAHLLLDGKNAPTLIPPAFGLAGVNLTTWEGWGSITHWNAFVAILEMGGQGTLFDPRLNDEEKFPIAAKNGFGNVRRKPDRVTKKLPALQFYQLALTAPPAPRGSFNKNAAKKGEQIFNDKAKCAQCHVPPIFTEPGWNMHPGKEIGIDNMQAERGPENAYRTSPLKGLWTHTKRGFFHDGRFSTLLAVVEHYNQVFSLDLSSDEKSNLVEYLKSL